MNGTRSGRIRGGFAVLALGCLLLTGCGSSGSTAGTTPPTTTQSVGTTSSTGSRPTITSVVFHREGGLKPVTVDRTFTAGQSPPSGFTADDVAAVFAAANAFTSSGDRLPPIPVNTCCDRYTYTVAISYSDGSVRAYRSIDGIREPAPFKALLSALQ